MSVFRIRRISPAALALLLIPFGSADGGVVELYEGNGASQDHVGTTHDRRVQKINFKGNRRIEKLFVNDEARSMVLRYPRVGTRITLFDSPSAKRNDDYTVIVVKKTAPKIVIHSFEDEDLRDDTKELISLEYHKDNGLDGKVSHMEISPGSDPAAGTDVARYEAVEQELQRAFDSWPKKRDNAYEWQSQGSNYRLWRPDVTFTADRGMFLSAKVDHIRNNEKDDHAVITISFDKDGTLKTASVNVSLADGDGGFSKALENVGALAAASGSKEALVAAAIANLANLMRQGISSLADTGGRLNFPAAVEHVQHQFATAAMKAFE